jgi:pilus assembly protein Flp/PilA
LAVELCRASAVYNIRSFATSKGKRAMVDYLLTWMALKSDRRAVTALEYGLIAAVIVATIIVGFQITANSVSTKFSSVGSRL